MPSDHVLGWTEDPDAVGPHSLVPYTCDQYIADLEQLLQSVLGADNKPLRDLQSTYGRLNRPFEALQEQLDEAVMDSLLHGEATLEGSDLTVKLDWKHTNPET